MHPENCKHFTGIHQKTCKLGIAYKDLGYVMGGKQGLPCLGPDVRPKMPCAYHCLPTKEEWEQEKKEQTQAVKTFLTQMKDREAKGLCWQCGKALTAKRQVGRCIYAEPCGCRLGQGTLRDGAGKRVARLLAQAAVVMAETTTGGQ